MVQNADSGKPFVVGVTGGIGSGKTAATNAFAELGITVVDADLISREVVEPGSPALDAIAKHFGRGILMTDENRQKVLDRKALRDRIFNDSEEKTWLEALLHPLIRRTIGDRLAAAEGPYTILSSPLLLETGQDAMVDRVLVIDVPEALQVERTAQRDEATAESVKAIMETQISRPGRLAKADDVLTNDKDLGHLAAEVRKLHDSYCKLAATKGNVSE